MGIIANLEALFILRCFCLHRLYDEMLFARLKPLAFDIGDFVSFLIPHKREWSVGIAAAGVAGDKDRLKWLRGKVLHLSCIIARIDRDI